MIKLKKTYLYSCIKKNKYHIYTTLSIIWMAVIFANSAFEGETSAMFSDTLVKLFLSVSGWLGKGRVIESVQEFIKSESFHLLIRKIGHFVEFGILGLLVFSGLGILYNIRQKTLKRLVIALIICTVYAVSDEIHQLFVAGRVFSFVDIFIDFTGVLIFLGVRILVIKRRGANHGS